MRPFATREASSNGHANAHRDIKRRLNTPCLRTAHKTAIKLPRTHPDYYRLWALIADYQAQMHFDRGHLFVTMAPMDHAAYRDLPNSGWEPASKDRRYMKDGYRSHRYVSTEPEPEMPPGSIEPETAAPEPEVVPGGTTSEQIAEPAQPSDSAVAAAMETLVKAGFLHVGERDDEYGGFYPLRLIGEAFPEETHLFRSDGEDSDSFPTSTTFFNALAEARSKEALDAFEFAASGQLKIQQKAFRRFPKEGDEVVLFGKRYEVVYSVEKDDLTKKPRKPLNAYEPHYIVSLGLKLLDTPVTPKKPSKRTMVKETLGEEFADLIAPKRKRMKAGA
jgi:hypothetical protein